MSNAFLLAAILLNSALNFGFTTQRMIKMQEKLDEMKDTIDNISRKQDYPTI